MYLVHILTSTFSLKHHSKTEILTKRIAYGFPKLASGSTQKQKKINRSVEARVSKLASGSTQKHKTN